MGMSAEISEVHISRMEKQISANLATACVPGTTWGIVIAQSGNPTLLLLGPTGDGIGVSGAGIAPMSFKERHVEQLVREGKLKRLK